MVNIARIFYTRIYKPFSDATVALMQKLEPYKFHCFVHTARETHTCEQSIEIYPTKKKKEKKRKKPKKKKKTHTVRLLKL